MANPISVALQLTPCRYFTIGRIHIHIHIVLYFVTNRRALIRFVAVARTDRDANGRTTTKKMCVFLSAIYKFDEQIRECLIVCPLIIGTHVADDNAHAHAPKHSWTPTGTKCLSHASLLAFACQASFFGAQTTHSYNANTRRKVSSEHIKQKNRNKKTFHVLRCSRSFSYRVASPAYAYALRTYVSLHKHKNRFLFFFHRSRISFRWA